MHQILGIISPKNVKYKLKGKNTMVNLEITTFDYEKADYKNWKLPYDYHCLYILENGESAYIGETKDVIQRSIEHKKKGDVCAKYKFTRIHVITGQTFEETPAKHYETLLRRLMVADGKFKNIVNAKRDEWQHYERKNEFELGFDKLWLLLEEKGLVKHKDFQSVLNLSSYKFSPHIELTKAQKETLTSIMHTIDSLETLPHREDFLARPIFISGDAGTGKTVVATSLFYKLRTTDKYKNLKIGLVYAVSPVRTEIQNLFKSVKELHKKDVVSPSSIIKEEYDIVICDEAHKLRQVKNAGRYYSSQMRLLNSKYEMSIDSDELDWLLKNSKCLILFYDSKQTTSTSEITKDSFDERLYARNRGIRPIALNEQMRIKAGADYVPYVYDVLYEKAKTQMNFKNYEFCQFGSFDRMFEYMQEKENEIGLCRLCGGYGWKWISKKDPDKPDIKIENTELWWNSQTQGWIENLDKKEEMGSIYTLQGMDLNYAFVVFGPEIYYDTLEQKIKIDKSNFFDNKVKRGCTEENLKKYILNTYGVLLTRGIYGTCVYACDPNLRAYLKKYIPMK